MPEVEIHIDADATGAYQFRVRLGRREFTTNMSPNLAASFYEDLRLLRWKSVGVHDPGDTLLSHVGDRLAALIAPPETWEELRVPNGALHVRVRFSQSAHRLMPFPWELLRVNEQFLIGTVGSHLVREVNAPGATRRRRPLLNVVHVSLGTDSALRFDEERCTLLETLPPSIPIEFLIDPSRGPLEAAVDVLRPHIVIVSGHGHYDDLRGEHYLSTNNMYVPTARLVEVCTSYGRQLLVLSTCESARLGGPVIDDATPLPADLIAFSSPSRRSDSAGSHKHPDNRTKLLAVGKGATGSAGGTHSQRLGTRDRAPYTRGTQGKLMTANLLNQNRLFVVEAAGVGLLTRFENIQVIEK